MCTVLIIYVYKLYVNIYILGLGLYIYKYVRVYILCQFLITFGGFWVIFKRFWVFCVFLRFRVNPIGFGIFQSLLEIFGFRSHF